MQPIEIIVIIAAVGIVLANILVFVYKRAKHLPTGECSCCGNHKKMHKAFTKVKDELEQEHKCCCGKCDD